MTPEQRKRVAEITTGKEWEVLRWRPFGADLYQKDVMHYPAKHQDKPEKWSPHFDGNDQQRSQALAVVKYLFGLSYSTVLAHLSTIRTAIQDDDIESLERLVLELSDE